MARTISAVPSDAIVSSATTRPPVRAHRSTTTDIFTGDIFYGRDALGPAPRSPYGVRSNARARPSLDLARCRAPRAEAAAIRRDRNRRWPRHPPRGGGDVRSAAAPALSGACYRRAASRRALPAARRVARSDVAVPL